MLKGHCYVYYAYMNVYRYENKHVKDHIRKPDDIPIEVFNFPLTSLLTTETSEYSIRSISVTPHQVCTILSHTYFRICTV